MSTGASYCVAAALLSVPLARAGESTTAVLDGGGGIVSGDSIEAEVSVGVPGGFSGDVATIAARHGFPGQIYDPAGELTVTPGDARVEEFGSSAFAAQLRCDDDSLLPILVDSWSIESPFATVTAEGIVQVGALPGDQPALLTATAGAFSGSATLLLRDLSPDNFGLWAADGIPDAWQALYFTGQEESGVASADPDADGQDNLAEYLAGTDPRDAASLLYLRFGPDPGAPGAKQFVFGPYLPDRTYTLEWSASLAAPWTALPDVPVAGSQPGEGEFTVVPGAGERRFFRLRIAVP